jgi:hypothetical protein
MKKSYLITAVVLIFMLTLWYASIAVAQFWPGKSTAKHQPYKIEDFRHLPKRPGHDTLGDWQTVIDTTWGEGRPTAEKLQIFDKFWDTIDQEWACFPNLVINWQGLRDQYRPEIEAGVSRGRFSGIMSKLSLALMEAHTKTSDLDIYYDTLAPGVPLLCLGNDNEHLPHDRGYFGAALTLMPDSSLLVYAAAKNHPCGLTPGDIVLGYDGIPWKDLMAELLTAELPVSSALGDRGGLREGFWGSSLSSQRYFELVSAGYNWHLFDTLDVKKYGSDEIVHYSTSLLVDQNMSVIGSDQLPPAGIPFPEPENGKWLSWGVIDGTNIGYLLLWSWQIEPIGEQLELAVKTLVNDYQVNGLIFDFRTNFGGIIGLANDTYTFLFNKDFDKMNFYERSNPHDHQDLKLWSTYAGEDFIATPFLYDKPIAILTGPYALSSGDINALRLKFHPMASVFGKPTNGAFVGGIFNSEYDFPIDMPFPEWVGVRVKLNIYLDDGPGGFLAHTDLEVDEKLWLSREDVAKGEDTVIKRAIEWINNVAYAHSTKVYPLYAEPGIDSTIIRVNVENPNQPNLLVTAYVKNLEDQAMDTLSLQPTGDSTVWQATSFHTEETTYTVSIQSLIEDVAHFTTIGPLEFVDFADDGHDPVFPYCFAKLVLRNSGSVSPARAVRADLIPLDDSNIKSIDNNAPSFGQINAGESVTSDYWYFIYLDSLPPDSINIPLQINIYSGNHHFWTDTATLKIEVTPIGIEDRQIVYPTTYALHQNYPTPFNPITTIEFALPKASHVTLKIFNILGEEVATLVSQKLPAGDYEYQWDAARFASGIYYYKFEAGDFVGTKKLVLLR